MSKRFRDTAIWQKPWFRKLKLAEKLAWDYILDNCDNVGVWVPDFEAAEFFIGEKIDWELFANSTNGNLEQLPNGKWWVVDFCRFQHGSHLLTRKSTPVVRSYLELLEIHGLKDRVAQQFSEHPPTVDLLSPNSSPTVDEQLPNSCQTVKGKGKGTGKGKGKGKGTGKGEGPGIDPDKVEVAPDVFMTQEQRAKLVEKYGEPATASKINELSGALGNTIPKDKYSDHYKTVITWIERDRAKAQAAAPYRRRVVHKFCKSCGAEYWGSACDCGWSE